MNNKADSVLSNRRLIGVIGLGHPDPALDPLAEKVGAGVAESGFVLVNGGLGGVMEASAKGCKEAGGTSVGILPGLDPAEANPYIDVPVATGLGEGRNLLIVRAASALIAIGGGYGTLSEIALALKTGKPVVGLNTWEISDRITRAKGPAEAVELALAAASRGGETGR